MVQRGEIYFVNLNPVMGREQGGERPVLVLSSNVVNNLPLVITVIAGTNGANIPRDFATNVRVKPSDSGLPLETVFLCFQIRALDHSRFPITPAGKLTDYVMRHIEDTVRYCLEL